MKKLVKMMNRYSELNMIPEGITICLESDGTGYAEKYCNQGILFNFDSIKQLEKRLSKVPTDSIFETIREN